MTDKGKLLSRRNVLAMLSAAGMFGFAGRRGGSGNDESTRGVIRSSRSQSRASEKGVTMKTIGVLGGLGPQATMDFEARLHQVCQRLIPQQQNIGYPRVVVYYYRHPPILLNEDHSPRLPIEPNPRLLEAAKQLGTLVDFLVIPSNTPHLLQERIEQAAGCKLLSMIAATLEEIQKRQWRKVGVLGLGIPIVYTKPLGEMKLPFETIEGELRAKLDVEIMKAMEGRDNAESAKIARDAIAALRAKKVEGIILGCTEIPLLLRETANEPDLVNPAQLLAEATVQHALV